MIESPRTVAVHESGPLDERTPGELSLVDIAERLERITAAIEAERVKEREARRQYRAVADEVEATIQRIRAYAQSLVQEQRRRMASFDGMLANGTGHHLREVKGDASEPGNGRAQPSSGGGGSGAGGRMSINDAVLKVWTLTTPALPLTTEEISQGLSAVGYSTRAAPKSIKSTLNQALAKLCRDGKVRRFRTDGTEIDPRDTHSRARKYLPT